MWPLNFESLPEELQLVMFFQHEQAMVLPLKATMVIHLGNCIIVCVAHDHMCLHEIFAIFVRHRKLSGTIVCCISLYEKHASIVQLLPPLNHCKGIAKLLDDLLWILCSHFSMHAFLLSHSNGTPQGMPMGGAMARVWLKRQCTCRVGELRLIVILNEQFNFLRTH